MLMTIGGVIAALVLLAISAVTKKTWLARFTLGGVAVWVVFYAAMLLGFSLTSKEKVLGLGEPKEYCGFYLDCHIHTTVTGVRTAKQIGGITSQGTFFIVNTKVFSDAKNPGINLHLLEPKAEVTDAKGRSYTRNTDAESLLPTASVRLDQDIKSSQIIEKEIVFDVPATSGDLKLLITEGYGIDKYIEAVLIGDEDSLFHKRNYFNLEPVGANAKN